MSPQALSAATVVPSSNPARDATSLADFVGPRFIRPTSGEESVGVGGATAAASITLISSSDDDVISSIPSTMTVLFVNFGTQQQQKQQREVEEVPPLFASAPNSTLMVTMDLIASVTMKNATSEDMGIVIVKYSVEDDYSWAVIRLSGGGTLLLASSVKAVYRYTCDVKKIVENKKANDTISIGGANGNEMMEGSADDSAIEDPPYKFPSLAISILSNKQILPGFQINTRRGVPIENDLFVGQVLLIMRPPDPTADPYYNEKVFTKKKRRLEIQIQGKFKYVPTGTVWCGFEVTEAMKLGLVASSLCNLLLRLVSKTVPGDMHFSFGDENNEEMAHISFPAWTLFDRVVVTKQGDEPPPLGEVLPEPAKAASQRKRSAKTGDWNTSDTYSFSYHSMYMDLSIWHVVNLPTPDIDLKTFWGNSLLRVVVYESQSASKDKHLQAENKYIAGIQAEYLGFDDDGINGMSEENDALPETEK